MNKVFEAAKNGNKITVDLGNGGKVCGFITQAEYTMSVIPGCIVEMRLTGFSSRTSLNRKVLIL